MERRTQLLLVAGLAAATIAGVGTFIVFDRLSTEALGVLTGAVCGVGAAIPTSLIIVAVTRRRDRQTEPLPAPPPVPQPTMYAVPMPMPFPQLQQLRADAPFRPGKPSKDLLRMGRLIAGHGSYKSVRLPRMSFGFTVGRFAKRSPNR